MSNVRRWRQVSEDCRHRFGELENLLIKQISHGLNSDNNIYKEY